MNSLIIGVIGRDEKINDDTIVQAITKDNLKYIHDKASYIGIINYDNNDLIDNNILDLCDAIIFQGGNKIYPYHFFALDYALKRNIPVLGICMGHQLIGLYSTSSSEEDLGTVENHNNKNMRHYVDIKEDSLLYKLFSAKLEVNSRHKEQVISVGEPFKVTATSEDGVIEAIEYIDDEHFVLGVQWHPENLDNMESLYNIFITEALKRKMNRNN